MHPVANQDEDARAGMNFALGLVAMAPKHESFKDYEDHDSCKENCEDVGRRDVRECMRNQSEERRPQKRADGITDQVGNEPLPGSRWKGAKTIP